MKEKTIDLELVRNIRNSTNNFCKLLGIEITTLLEGSAKAEVTIREEHLNSQGTAHGGLIMTLADAAAGSACAYCGNMIATISQSINFVSAAKLDEVLIATATEVRHGKRVMFVDVRVCSSETVVAVAQYAFADLQKPIQAYL